MGLFAGTPFDIPAHCDRCEKLESECLCPPVVVEPLRIPPNKQTARIGIEKRSKGKWVTVVRDLPEVGNDLPALLTELKNKCGAGGTIKDGVIEIQGDHLTRVREQLKIIGFRVKG